MKSRKKSVQPIGLKDITIVDDAKMRKAITAAALGNAMEWFDFGVYGFVAFALGKVFFPNADPSVQMIAALATFSLGTLVAIGPALQIRLMDVAGDAQTLAAALNHSAFNAANALGAWLGGVAISAGLGASVRLRPSINPGPFGDPAGLTNQKKQATGHISTTVAIENQHPDFASLPTVLPMAGGANS